MPQASDTRYIGRFAPTPSGALHFGSLIAALASFLDARAVDGLWRVRIEDLDPPREQPGALQSILQTLEAFGLEWDGELLYQSRRQSLYQQAVQDLLDRQLAYHCTCSRKDLAAFPGPYPGFCRDAGHPETDAAVRLRVPEVRYGFRDRLQGPFSQQLGQEVGDFIIRRRDRLFAYQLAVVIDDAEQQITDIVRGADLLDSTPRQLYLQSLFGYPQPQYLHLPVIVQPDGQKLGKRYRSLPLSREAVRPMLLRALRTLGQRPPAELEAASRDEILHWAIRHWQTQQVPQCLQMVEDTLE